jgi:hypothetical protein
MNGVRAIEVTRLDTSLWGLHTASARSCWYGEIQETFKLMGVDIYCMCIVYLDVAY